MTQAQAGGRRSAHRFGVPSRYAAKALLCLAYLAALPASADTTAPIELAVFDFEFEDFSAGASTRRTPSDTEHLARVTEEVRHLLVRSGRYRLVDVSDTEVAAAKARTLRHCDGCDAAIALSLGAEQSFVGVVRRITRTEYQVRFQIRDTRTGAVVADENSGLRMGADYSWSRGAVRLIEERLLENPPQQ